MTEASPAEPSPSNVASSKSEKAEPESEKDSVPAAVPSSGTAHASVTTASTAAPLCRSPASPTAVPQAVSGSSRAAKSKKKKGGGGSGGSACSGENTGRWTAEEHRLFLQGLEQHGKGWKKIASLIKSRTVVQIRTHAQKYFQKLAKARQNGEEGEISMEGRGGISTITSTSLSVGGHGSKRRRQQTGTKRKAIHSVVSSAQREGKKIALEQEAAGVQNPVPPLPAVSPVLAHFVLPETSDSSASNKSVLASSNNISGPMLEDSIFRFLTPTPVVGVESTLNDVARQAGANPITLPSDLPGTAPTVGGEISPTGVADFSLCPSWTDGKDPPAWYAKGADVEALLDVADTLDWLADPGDSNETYQGPEESASAVSEEVDASDEEKLAEALASATDDEAEPEGPDPEVMDEELPEVEVVENVDQQLPSIFDGAPESSDHLAEDKLIPLADSAVNLGDAATHAPIDEPLFDTPMEEHDFVSTILENESSADLPGLE